MPRPIEAVIDRKAFRHNLAVIRGLAGDRFLWAVSKANSYGHGLGPLIPSLDKADGIAVLDIKEAILARAEGWQKPLFLIEGFFDASDLEIVDNLDLEILVHSNWQIRELAEHKFSHPVKTHIKVNTGMNRLGFRPMELDMAVNALRAIPAISLEDIVTHFANAENDYPMDGVCSVAFQARQFASCSGFPSCLANSAAILWHPEISGRAVRAGIVMYGVSPSGSTTSEDLGLVPVMTLNTKILSIHVIEKGEAIGYGSRYIAQKRVKIAVIACGYADGYPRQRSENRHVLVRGLPAPIVGSISMDMITIDVTDIPDAEPGDLVELWGKDLPVNEVAALHDTIGYELLANLNERVPRRYIN